MLFLFITLNNVTDRQNILKGIELCYWQMEISLIFNTVSHRQNISMGYFIGKKVTDKQTNSNFINIDLFGQKYKNLRQALAPSFKPLPIKLVQPCCHYTKGCFSPGFVACWFTNMYFIKILYQSTFDWYSFILASSELGTVQEGYIEEIFTVSKCKNWFC